MISSYLAAPILAWLIAQFVKFAGASLKSGRLEFHWLWRSGGLPSSHSAIVSSLAAVIFVVEGADSVAFAIALVMTLVVLYDAVGVRRATGMNSQALINIAPDKSKLPADFKVVLGHRPSEMISGVALGIIVALAVTYSDWWSPESQLTDELAGFELAAAFFLCLLFIVVSVSALVWLKKKQYKKLPSTSKLRRWTIGALLIPSITVLVLVGAANQSISPLSWRIWTWAILVAVVFIQIFVAFSYYKQLPRRLREEREHFEASEEKVRNSRRKKRKKKNKQQK